VRHHRVEFVTSWAARKSVFVSYRSVNANEAREVVDCLLANGIDAWFAEYRVLAGNYYLFEAYLDNQLAAAIDDADFALIFSNNAWADSGHCQREIARIARVRSPERILHITIPREEGPQTVAPILEKAPSIDYYESTFAELLAFLEKHLQHPLPVNTQRKALALTLGSSWARLPHGQFRLGPLSPLSGRSALSPIARAHSMEAVGRIDGDIEVFLTITTNPYSTAVDAHPQLGHAATPRTSQSLEDDRTLYRHLRKRAARWQAEGKLVERGLHLLHWSGRTHLALTFGRGGTRDGKAFRWTRLYALVMPDTHTEFVGEVDFEFNVAVPAPDEATAFRRLCGVTNCFDRMIASFAYSGYAPPELKGWMGTWLIRPIAKYLMASASGACLGYVLLAGPGGLRGLEAFGLGALLGATCLAGFQLLRPVFAVVARHENGATERRPR
jgi:hypothetical protein